MTERCQRGFTLVELIMVIVLMGVIGGMVSVFMKSPIDAYFDSARRAALTDTADTVVRRMARDIHKALPNSINASGDGLCVEFIPTKTGGRYRAADSPAGVGTSLVFGAPDASFNMLGNSTTFAGNALPTEQVIAPGDVIALTNLGFGVANAYAGSNTAVLTGVAPGTEAVLTFGTKTFDIALASPSNRFQVIPAYEKVVAYVCTNNNVYRVVSTSLGHICPATVTATAPAVSAAPILAQNVTCNLNYSGSDLQRNALLSMRIQVTDSGESVTL